MAISRLLVPPKLSVILPVYNGLPYLEEAIKSVLHQSFRNFELLVINDGSTDGSMALIEKLDDPRVRFFQQENKGLAATLNGAISLSRGQYIARQDQDDVCFPLRFQKQVEFLDAHPDVGMVGTSAEIWVGNERTNRLLEHPTDDPSLKFNLLFNNYFVHSSIMIRRSVLEEVGGYSEDKSRQPPEDYELWSRVMRKYKVSNLPEVLMAYREVPSSMSRAGVNPFLHKIIKISAENIAWASGRAADSPEVIALSKLWRGIYDDIPRGIGFPQMEATLKEAALRIAKASGISYMLLEPVFKARIRRLRYIYLDYRSGGLVGRMMGSRAGNHVKKVAARILKGTHL